MIYILNLGLGWKEQAQLAPYQNPTKNIYFGQDYFEFIFV